MMQIALIALLAGQPLTVAPPPPAPPPPPSGSLPVPLSNPGEWVTSDDYPADALRSEQAGTVAFRLTVTPAGVVSACQITMSSGTASLDATACSLLSRRARFNPARDAYGKPTTGTYSNRVRWQIPEPRRESAPLPGAMVTSMLVEKDGTSGDCRIESVEGGASAFGKPGPMPCKGPGYLDGFRDDQGKPIKRRIRTTIRIEVLPE